MLKTKARPYKTAIVLPDMQVPYEDSATLEAVEAYMADEHWDYYINLGDFMDFDVISRWNKDLPRKKIGKLLAKDYEHGNKVLDRHLAAARNINPSCEMFLLEGNHDFRMTDYLDRNPELEGIMEVPDMLRLKERKITWVPVWTTGKPLKIGKAYFHHGRYTNKYHAFKMVDQFGVSIFYGHAHDIQEYSRVIMGKDKTIVGKSLGCLCEYEQSYIKGNPTNWQQALAVFWFFPDGFFQEVTVRIFKHRFVGPTNGRIYEPAA